MGVLAGAALVWESVKAYEYICENTSHTVHTHPAPISKVIFFKWQSAFLFLHSQQFLCNLPVNLFFFASVSTQCNAYTPKEVQHSTCSNWSLNTHMNIVGRAGGILSLEYILDKKHFSTLNSEH